MRPGEVHALAWCETAQAKHFGADLIWVIAPDEGRLSLHGKELVFCQPKPCGSTRGGDRVSRTFTITKLTLWPVLGRVPMRSVSPQSHRV